MNVAAAAWQRYSSSCRRTAIGCRRRPPFRRVDSAAAEDTHRCARDSSPSILASSADETLPRNLGGERLRRSREETSNLRRREESRSCIIRRKLWRYISAWYTNPTRPGDCSRSDTFDDNLLACFGCAVYHKLRNISRRWVEQQEPAWSVLWS